MDSAGIIGARTCFCLLLLPPDAARKRGNRAHGAHSRSSAPRCHVLLAAAIQGGGHGVLSAGGILRAYGLRPARAKRLGAGGIPHRRFLLGPCRILGHEDGHLRLGAHGQCRAEVAQRRPAHSLPQRRSNGACGRGAWIARHIVLVHHP